jgi:aspartate aminotransferase
MSLVNEGDEVIVTDPTYLGYKEMIELAQGNPKRLPVSVDNEYQPDSEDLKQVVSKRTKAVMVLSPDNPTGRIVKEEFVKCLIDLAQDYDFWIISDDIYKHMIYEGEHLWISEYPNAKERTITVCSFSKEAGIPGLRIGYTLAPSQAIDRIEKMQQYSTLAPDTLAQFALVKFLRTDMKETYLKDRVLPVYTSRRKVMGDMLARFLPDARTVIPQGAFYYFVDMRPYLSKLQISEEEFAERLLKEKSVAVIPGRFFGENGKGHVRVTFVSENEERIGRGVEEMFKLVSRTYS